MIRYVIVKAHLQEAHVQSKELQGCQAHREPQEPGAGGEGGGEASHQSFGRLLGQDSEIGDRALPLQDYMMAHRCSLLSSPTFSIVKTNTDIWLQHSRLNRNFFFVAEFPRTLFPSCKKSKSPFHERALWKEGSTLLLILTKVMLPGPAFIWDFRKVHCHKMALLYP